MAVNQLAEAMLQYRAYHQLSRADFAHSLGMTEMGICDIERGKNLPAISTIKSVARLIGWTPEDVGVLVLSLPLEPMLYVVEGVDGRRPAGRSSAGAQEGERVLVVGPGGGDRPGQEVSDADGEGRGAGVGANSPGAGGVLPVEPG